MGAQACRRVEGANRVLRFAVVAAAVVCNPSLVAKAGRRSATRKAYLAFLCALTTALISGAGASSVTLTPAIVSFGMQAVGATKGGTVLQITNTGSSSEIPTVQIFGTSCPISLGVPSQICSDAQREEALSFAVLYPCGQIAPGESCPLILNFSPKASRKLVASLLVRSANGILAQAELVGTGVPAQTVAGTALAVEFFNRSLNHYFLTHLTGEIADLDSGRLAGWERTGYSFWVWPDAAPAPENAQNACRFYGLPEAGLDSHFYTLSAFECDEVVRRFSSSWSLESRQFFAAFLPDAQTGMCPPSHRPVFRLFNGRKDANHRFIPSREIDYRDLLARGWIAEGYGPDGVAFCAAPGRYAVQ